MVTVLAASMVLASVIKPGMGKVVTSRVALGTGKVAPAAASALFSLRNAYATEMVRSAAGPAKVAIFQTASVPLTVITKVFATAIRPWNFPFVLAAIRALWALPANFPVFTVTRCPWIRECSFAIHAF